MPQVSNINIDQSARNVASARVTNYMKQQGWQGGYTDANGDWYWKDKNGKLQKRAKKYLPEWFNETQAQAGE